MNTFESPGLSEPLSQAPVEMSTFESLGLSTPLNQALVDMNYSTPTPIQAQSIPLALQGRDILGSAQTGTGKTAAYSIPLIESLIQSKSGSALVLSPTRELAKQILDVIHQLLAHHPHIKTALLIGGEQMGKQYFQLRRHPRIIVGTPGRINDHLERRSLRLNDAGFLVLDETDRMLDMGFGIQLEKIFEYLPKQRQTLMFSATLPDKIVKLASTYLTNHEHVAIGNSNMVAITVKQDVLHIEQEKKQDELIKQLSTRNGSIIVFVKSKFGTEKMAKMLSREGFEADALHGDLKQSHRTRVMSNFREQKFRILVATDIAARGLDVPHIEHVINYDLPQAAEDYVHRMGRTGRAGSEGNALSFVSSQDNRKWYAIECLLDPSKKLSSTPKSGFKKKKTGFSSSGRKPQNAVSAYGGGNRKREFN